MFISAGTGHELVPDELAPAIPALRSTDGQAGDAVAQVKLFCASFTWFLTEADVDPTSEDFGLAFGLVVNGDIAELGSFHLQELASLDHPAPLVLGVERDFYFTPVPLRDLRTAGEQVPVSSAEFLFRERTARP